MNINTEFKVGVRICPVVQKVLPRLSKVAVDTDIAMCKMRNLLTVTETYINVMSCNNLWSPVLEEVLISLN